MIHKEVIAHIARRLPHQQQQPDHKPGMRVEGRGIESVMIYMNCYSY